MQKQIAEGEIERFEKRRTPLSLQPLYFVVGGAITLYSLGFATGQLKKPSSRRKWKWTGGLLNALGVVVLLVWAPSEGGRLTLIGVAHGEHMFHGRPARYWAWKITSDDDATSTLKSGGPSAVPVLVEIWTDALALHTPESRELAFSAIGSLPRGTDANGAVPALISVLRYPGNGDAFLDPARSAHDWPNIETDIPAKAADALLDIGPDAKAAIPDLMRYVNGEQQNNSDVEFLRSRAFEAIQMIDPAALRDKVWYFGSRKSPVYFVESLLFLPSKNSILLTELGGKVSLRRQDGDTWLQFHDGMPEVLRDLPDSMDENPPEDAGIRRIAMAAILPDGRTMLTRYHGVFLKHDIDKDTKWEVVRPPVPKAVMRDEANAVNFDVQRARDWLKAGLPITLFAGSGPAGGYRVLSPNGKTVATANTNKPYVELWDVESGTLSGKVKWAMPTLLMFSPDSSRLILGGGATQAETVLVIDAKNAAVIQSLKSRSHRPSDANFCLDGKVIACANTDGSVVFWDVASGKELGERTWSGVHLLFPSPDGNTLAATGQDGFIRFWKLKEMFPER